MNQYPFFVRHKGIGVINEMINIAIDIEEIHNINMPIIIAVPLSHCIEANMINEKQLSYIIFDLIQGWKVIQDNKIIYPEPTEDSLVVSVQNQKGKIGKLVKIFIILIKKINIYQKCQGHINPRNFSPNSKIKKKQTKTFLKVLYNILTNEQIDGADLFDRINTRIPQELQILFNLICEQSFPDYISYYEKEILNNNQVLEFYKVCINRDASKTEYPYDQVSFIEKYCLNLCSYNQQNTLQDFDSTIMIENSPSSNSNKTSFSSLFINSKFTNQDVFISYFKFLNDGELIKAYDVIKTYEEQNEVDSITYLALSNTLCKIVESKMLNEYLKSLNEEDLIKDIENEEKNKIFTQQNSVSEVCEQNNDLFKIQKKQKKDGTSEQSDSSSSEDSNTSLMSEEASSQDLLFQLENFPSKKKLTLKQCASKIKETYNQSINKNPYSVISYFNLSLEYCSTTQIDIIIKLLKKCLIIQSQDHEVLYQLSVLYWNKQDYEQALKYFKKQLYIKNFDIPLCINIFKAYQKLNKIQSAIYFFKKFEQKQALFRKVSEKLWSHIELEIYQQIDPNITLQQT